MSKKANNAPINIEIDEELLKDIKKEQEIMEKNKSEIIEAVGNFDINKLGDLFTKMGKEFEEYKGEKS